MSDENTDEKQVAFLPFHAINEFMLDDYRLQVIRTTLQGLPNLPENLRQPVDELTRQAVRVPGFRNSLKAPVSLRARPVAAAFEKSPQLVAAILSAWAEIQAELREKVYHLMIARGWEILPPEADRSVLPGFLTKWPDGETFDVLDQAFEEMYPATTAEMNDISLMVVWLGGRLPYNMEGKEEGDQE